MQQYKADLHIHTVLSPCGDLDMSPSAIVERAVENGLDIIGITDHNTTKHCKLAKQLGEKAGLFVVSGVEITTKEEAHCLAFFETDEQLNEIQQFLTGRLPQIPNSPDKFGYQVVVDENEQIIDQEDIFLLTAIEANVNEIERFVHDIGGIFIPAHVNRPKFSLISQLGFVPPDLNVDALEISRHTTKEIFINENAYLKDKTFIQSSDAHFINDIGSISTTFMMEALTFSEFRKAFSTGNVFIGDI